MNDTTMSGPTRRDQDTGAAAAAGQAPASAGESAETARPDESRRDPDRTGRDLEAWLAGLLEVGAKPEVTSVHVPESNGMSSETVLVDASWRGPGGRENHELVVRIAPDTTAVPVFPNYDLDEQFRTMATVAELTDVPVPELYWSEPDPAPLGAPFFVMGRVDGDVPPDVLPYNFGDSWLSEATPEQLARIERSSVEVLCQLHSIDNASEAFSHLPAAAPDPERRSALRRHVAELRAYYEWVCSDGHRSPLIETCFDWLEDNWPEDEGEARLSWGDARIGNIMYRDHRPVAVLDWEMATIAPREVDLGWMIFLHRFFEDIAATFELPGMPDFLRRDTLVSLYEELSGHTVRDMDFYTLYAALRHAVIMSQVQRRAIAFGTAEMPEDVDDLIMHRVTLQQMLEGSYWERVLTPAR